MLRKVLNKFHANNLQEIVSGAFNNMRRDKTPEDYVQEVKNGIRLKPRQFEFADLLETNRLGDILPYEWYDKETGIYQTTRAHGFIFECGSLVGCNKDLDDQLKGLFNLGIPDGTCMQVMLLASSELSDKFSQYEALRQTPLLKKLARERIKFYQGGLKETLRLGYKLPVRDFKLVISFTFDGLFTDSNQAALVSLQESISAVLKNSFVNNRLMPPDTFINLLRELLCTSMSPVEKHIYDERRPIRDQVADIDNNIYVDADGMCINDIGIKSIAVGRYPDQFEISSCNKFIGEMLSMTAQISHPFFIVQNITFLNQANENRKLQASALKTAEQVKKGKFTSFFPLFHRKHAEYQMLQHAISSGEGLVLMSHYVHVYHPLGQSLSAFQEIKSLYKTFGFQMVTNSNLQLPSLLCSLPLFHDFTAAVEQKRYRMMSLYTQTNVVNLMPLFADYKGTGNPLLMFISSRGQLQFFDLFQTNSNYNVAISAKSGAGKSFVTNEILTCYRAINAKLTIIDVGRSYKASCAVNDGQYVEFTNESSMKINPFSFIKLKLENNFDFDLRHITKEQLLALEDLDDQITMLKSIFLVSAGIAEDDPNYQLADSYFEEAIINSLQKYQIASTYTTVHDELLELAKTDDKSMAKSLAQSIRSYTKDGIFGRYFEGQANLNIDNPLIVLELEELQSKGNLKFIVLLILMLKVTQDMYLADKKQKKLCIIDEAWDLMAGGNTGKFIMTGYRRARKYNGSFITITQNVDDYAQNATTQACYNSSAIKIMLMQDQPKNVELDPYVSKLLQTIKSEVGVYSELIIQIDKTTALCRFIVDDFTQLLYTTTADDSTLIKLIRESEQFDIVPALERLIAIRNSYMKKYNRPRQGITVELLQRINTYGYQRTVQDLDL